jgi:hypothetical protein
MKYLHKKRLVLVNPLEAKGLCEKSQKLGLFYTISARSGGLRGYGINHNGSRRVLWRGIERGETALKHVVNDVRQKRLR